MGLVDGLKAAATNGLATLGQGVNSLLSGTGGPPLIFTPRVTSAGSWEEWWSAINQDLSSATPAQLFREQPHLRTVVTFRARNTAQLGLHAFRRVGENDRQRDRTSVVAKSLRWVDGVMTTYELIFALVGDLDLYDRAHWLVIPWANSPSGWMIRRLPPAWVTPEEQTAFEVTSWRITYGRDTLVVPAGMVLSFTGYSPTDPRVGSSTVESLKGTLQEQIEAALYRSQVWKRGGRVSAVLERPVEAPEWSSEAREAFREDWYAKYTGRGSKAGGTPILEDGMKLNRVDFTAQEQQFVEASKLAMVTVAAAYHVNPTMVGQNDGANYSVVKEHRKALYGDTLGPILAQIEGRLNTFLIPMLGGNPDVEYVEFNIEEKLQGNFEEQSEAIQSATGAPWMTRNEARALRNLPRVEGGDELVVPLNVLIGGQASPRDADSTDPFKMLRLGPPGKAVQDGRTVKAMVPPTYEEQAFRVLSRFFTRQGQVIRSQVGAGREWWDKQRWDTELRSDLQGLYALTSTQAGRSTLAQLGINPEDYDEPRTQAFLLEAARQSAEAMNETTREAVQKALDELEPDGSPSVAVGGVFEVAADSRAKEAAITVVSFAAGFGTIEAARQQAPGATKTWKVNSNNPRPEHAAMDGETVGIDDRFSNGLEWPGAFGPAEQTARCRCSVSINIPDA